MNDMRMEKEDSMRKGVNGKTYFLTNVVWIACLECHYLFILIIIEIKEIAG